MTLVEMMRYIVALAWVYVVLMMSFAEQSAVAGVMTFLLYAVVPWTIILYVMGSPRRRRARMEAEKSRTGSTPPIPGADSDRPSRE